ncbi:MAG: NAD(P)H-dependent flavin oxidoreductase [Cellvibrionaceae bacterium]
MGWNKTPVSERLDIEYPIIQGPFGGNISTLDLLSVVSNAGGMGSFGAHMLAPDEIISRVANAKLRTDKAFNFNLWVSNDGDTVDGRPSDRVSVQDVLTNLDPKVFDRGLSLFKPFYDELGIAYPSYPERITPRFDEQMEAILEARPPVFSFVFGIPEKKILDACQQRDITTLGAATTFDEARALAEEGVDIVLATGFEAGGHRVSFLKPAQQSLMSTHALVRQINYRLDIPLIAAGGIADARGIAAAQIAGADAVQIGTAFLACRESGASEVHKQALFSERAHETVLSCNYTGRLARFIPDEFIDAIDRSQDLPLPYPLHSFFVAPIKAAAAVEGNAEFSSLYAGQGAPLLQHRDAGSLMAALVEQLNSY